MRYSYFDGLRGWASIVVLINHIFPNFLYFDATLPSVFLVILHPRFSLDFLTTGSEALWSVVYLFISDGALAVKVFFVISGFVLSIGYFRKRDRRIVYRMALARYPRLTIPIFASCLLASIVLVAGLTANHQLGPMIANAWIDKWYSFVPTVAGFLSFSLFGVYFQYSEAASYNFALWTMGVELEGSVLLFLTFLFVSDLKARYYIYAAAGLGLAFVSPNILCFLAGMLLADLEVRTDSSLRFKLPQPAFIALILLFLIAPLMLTKLPENIGGMANAFVAFGIVGFVLVEQRVQTFLENPLSEWAGKLSFPLYLIHPILLCSVVSAFGMVIVPAIGLHGGLALTAIFAIAICVAGAFAFYPVEILATHASRSFADLSLSGIASLKRRFASVW